MGDARDFGWTVNNGLLTVAAFFPALVVQAVAQDGQTRLLLAGIALVAALCGALVLILARSAAEETLQAEQIKTNGSEGFGAFLTYTVPALAPIDFTTQSALAVGVFAGFAIIMALRSRMIAGNPFLLLLGYRAHDIEATSGVTYILLRKRVRGNPGKTYTAKRLSDLCYVEI